MQVSITSIKILGHYIHYLENPHLNYQHFRKSDRPDALDPSIKQELSERSGETWAKIYEPGAALTTVAFSVLRQMDLPGLAQPILEEVSSSARETSHLGMLEGDQIRFLAASEPDIAVRVASRLGKNLPAHCTSTGKALLAELTQEQLRVIYPTEKLPGVTEFSIRSRSELESQLAEIRERGFAVNREESEEGVGSMAMAVPSDVRPRSGRHTGRPLAAATGADATGWGSARG